MDNIILLRYCCICLIPEENHEEFCSIFANNGKAAQRIHKLTGISPVEVDENIPSLICQTCAEELRVADNFRQRILDGNEHLSKLTAFREIELFEENLQDLKSKVHENEEKTEQHKYSPEKIREIKAPNPRNQLLQDRPTRNRQTPTTVDEKGLRKRRREESPPWLPPAPTRKRSNKNLKTKKQTTFECDTCENYFLSYKELIEHINKHILDEEELNETESEASAKTVSEDEVLEKNTPGVGERPTEEVSAMTRA